MSACGSAPAPAPYWLLFWVEGGSVSVDSRTAEEKEEDEEDYEAWMADVRSRVMLWLLVVEDEYEYEDEEEE